MNERFTSDIDVLVALSINGVEICYCQKSSIDLERNIFLNYNGLPGREARQLLIFPLY